MRQHEEIMADIESELESFRSVLDEYEQTIDSVDRTLSNSKLDMTEGTAMVSADEKGAGNPQPAD